MLRIKNCRKNERGSTLVEFSIGVTVFLTAMFGVMEFGRALWVHNALTDAARRGARYATMHSPSDINGVKNVVVYGDPTGSGMGDTRVRSDWKHRRSTWHPRGRLLEVTPSVSVVEQ